MQLTHRSVEGVHIVSIKGELNTHNAKSVESEVLALLDEVYATLALDLRDLSYLSSAGLRTLLRVAEHVSREGRRVVLIRLPPHVRNTIALGGLLSVLDVDPSCEAALARFN